MNQPGPSPLGAVAFAAFGQDLLPLLFPPGEEDGGEVLSGNVLRVGTGDGGTATITEALAKANERTRAAIAAFKENGSLFSNTDVVPPESYWMNPLHTVRAAAMLKF